MILNVVALERFSSLGVKPLVGDWLIDSSVPTRVIFFDDLAIW
jgi:hypothetical protein